MEGIRDGRRKRVRARSFLGAAAISASLTPAACAFLAHQHQHHHHHQCHRPTRPAPSTPPPAERSWSIARGRNGRSSSLRRVRCLPARTEEIQWQFKPSKWPPLVRSIPKRGGVSGGGKPEATESGLGGGGGGSGEVPGLTKSMPRSYQVGLFRSVMECERNSLVYLPTGLGKTLVASMVLKRLLDLNPGRQAFFLVETAALAAQQAERLRDEVEMPIETLTGSSVNIGGKGDSEKKRQKLESIRGASIVVATAGAFELAMHQGCIDPESACCVVLDEAHRCAKRRHPFGRVARTFLTAGAAKSASAPLKSASELPKVVALTASPAAELTVLDTVLKIKELLDRLEADLVAPVGGLKEEKRLTSPVDLELVYVALTSAEITLLTCLQRLVLSGVVRRAPEGSDVRAEAKGLLESVDHWAKHPGNATRATERAAASSLADDDDDDNGGDSLRFPNPAYTALCNRALAPGSSSGGGGGGGGRKEGEDDDDDPSLGKVMHAAFAIDEIGGVTSWRRVLGLLEGMRGGGGGGGGGDESDRPELEEAIRVLRAYLPEDAAAPGAGVSAGVAVEEPDPFGSKVAGSKLSQIALLLEQHKQECDESGDDFSALVLVSRRELALQLPAMLEAIPSLRPFVKAEYVVGQSRMSLAGRRSALASFKSGSATVLVSTSVGADGIEVPVCTLVVCTSLPSGGAELTQLRGRIRNYGENTRFVGLTRTSRVEDQVHAERLLTREKNTLEAVKLLTGGVGIHYIPMTSVTPVDGDFPPPCFTTKNFASISLEADGSDNRWKCDLPATLAPPATRASAMAHLAVCVKRARQTNPSENARSAMNSAVQLAHTIKPSLWFDERKEPSWYDGQMFRARCVVSSQPGELKGLLLVKEGRGLSLKAAREAAALKAVQYLLWVSKAHTAQPLDFAA